jgi:ATP/maltotriose-dependent transcriptional regulator MalT/DNA-binding SARP family transcriptional activator
MGYYQVPVLPTKLTPPQIGKKQLRRERIVDKLGKLLDYRLTLVRAGAGCGKSLAVSAILAEVDANVAWINFADGDDDPHLVYHYLLAAIAKAMPAKANNLLQILPDTTNFSSWRKAIEELILQLSKVEGECLLVVLDDYHLVEQEQEVNQMFNHLIAYGPEWLRLIVISREEISWPGLYRLQVNGQVLEINRDDLMMEPAEIKEFFAELYQVKLTPKELDEIWQHTEGWPIALHLLAQGLKSSAQPKQIGDWLPVKMEPLFQYLAQEVLMRQPEQLRLVLLQLAVLEEFNQAACISVLGLVEEAGLLKMLKKKGLFLISLGNGYYRYHHLFREFLQQQLKQEEYLWWQLNQRAAEYYHREGQAEKALGHLLEAQSWEAVAKLLLEIAPVMLESGRGASLKKILEKLPDNWFKLYPLLLVFKGDVARMVCDFQQAELIYRAALALAQEQEHPGLTSAANKGLALIYLDTVQPGPAKQYLRRAYQALARGEVEERAKLVQLMAENKINQGKPAQARRYQRLANEMFHIASRGDLEARLLLRTGRLDAAQELLGQNMGKENKQRSPRSHRETSLLLSLIHAFKGEQDQALIAAREGITAGEYLNSPFVVAVGYMRLGHAQLLQQPPQLEAAVTAYQQALAISEQLGVVRGRIEALMGLCLAYAYQGDLKKVIRLGAEGIGIAEQVRDYWFANVLRLAQGIGGAMLGSWAMARESFIRCKEGFRRCGDSHLLALSCWWLVYLAHQEGCQEQFNAQAKELLGLCQVNGYDFLLTRRTLLGQWDAKISVPLLLEARRLTIRNDYVNWLLAEMGLTGTDSHPGYTLRIQTLGRFRVWRGDTEVKLTAWPREKAKQLFQLLLTNRRRLMHKEQIIEDLWSEKDLTSSDNEFKVVLNSLMKVLEPNRSPRSKSAFIIREGSAYSLNLASGYWLDVDEFESLVDRAFRCMERNEEQAISFFKAGLELYQGDFLQEVLYEDWCLKERERLASLYIQACESLAKLLNKKGDYVSTIELCDRILSKDNCWEEAYRLKMQCFARLNNKSMVVRVYQKCQETLLEELGVSPSQQTSRLYQQLSE